MLIALLTDIHANREAFDACHAEAKSIASPRILRAAPVA
jgi:hypothetical protein